MFRSLFWERETSSFVIVFKTKQCCKRQCGLWIFEDSIVRSKVEPRKFSRVANKVFLDYSEFSR